MANIDNAYLAGQKVLCGGYTAYTPTGASYFKKAKRYYTVPKKGDVVYFYHASQKRIAHVGIVSSVNIITKTFKTIEGNTSSSAYSRNGGCVAQHEYSYSKVGNGSLVDGFGRPKYDNATCTANDVIAVATAEIGYEEKKSNAKLDSMHENAGNANYTKYGKWFGLNPAYWCAEFVSWVFYTACKKHLESNNTGWYQDEVGNWFYKSNGILLKNCWQEIGGHYYYFNSNGRMLRGWVGSASTGWYWCGTTSEAGYMQTSKWIEYNGKWYYLTATGLMAHSAYIKYKDGRYCWVDESGAWDGKYITSLPVNAEIAL